MSIKPFLYLLAFIIFVGWFVFLFWWENKGNKKK